MKNINNKRFSLDTIIPQGFNKIDFAVVAVIYLGCWFLFCYGDIFVTSSYSHAYLDGHIFDFNRFNKSMFPNGNIDYMYPIYIIFAVWLLPLKLFGLLTPVADRSLKQLELGGVQLYPAEVIWLKLLLVLSVAACSLVIYKILIILGENSKRNNSSTENKQTAKLFAWLFIANPIVIYAAMIFTGYDIFGLTLTMLGFYYFLKRDHKRFILFFALAIPFKYFALIPFIALLLLVRKNIGKVFLNLLAAGSLSGVLFIYATLIDKGSTVIRLIAAVNSQESFSIGALMSPSLELLAMIVIYFICYITNVDGDDEKYKRSAVWLGFASLIAVFTFIPWHPMWLILLIPWFLFAFGYVENKEYAYLITSLGLFAIFVKIFDYYDWCDYHLFSDGALRQFFPAENIKVGNFIPNRIIPFFDAITLVFFTSPFILRLLEKKGISLPRIGLFKTEVGYIRLMNYGGIAFYLVLVFAMLALTIKFPGLVGGTESIEGAIIGYLEGGN